jgi:hypothetical protein
VATKKKKEISQLSAALLEAMDAPVSVTQPAIYESDF